MKKLIDTWAPVLVWMLLIFSFSSLPTNPVSEIHWKDFIVKKSGHIAIYAILTLLIYRAQRESGVSKKMSAINSVAISIIYGLSDEYHQSFTPGRDSQIRDVFFDALGSLLSIYFIWYYIPKAPKRIVNFVKKI